MMSARYFSDRLTAHTNALYLQGGSTISKSDFLLSMFCFCFKMAQVTASILVSAGFRPFECSRTLSFKELKTSATIVLRFWYGVMDVFIQEAA